MHIYVYEYIYIYTYIYIYICSRGSFPSKFVFKFEVPKLNSNKNVSAGVGFARKARKGGEIPSVGLYTQNRDGARQCS